MKIIAAITSPEQDDVIEKLLRHIARWDPPWKRVRKARAPPRSPVPQPDAPAPWPELIDPPHPDTDCVDPVFEDEQEA